MKKRIILLFLLAINLSYPIIANTESLADNKAAIVDTYTADLKYVFDDPIVGGTSNPIINGNKIQLINGEPSSVAAIVTKQKIDLNKSWELDVDIEILCNNEWCGDGGGVTFLKNKDKVPGEKGSGLGMLGLPGYGFYTNVYRSNVYGIPRGFGIIGDTEKFQDRTEIGWHFYNSKPWKTNLKVNYDPRRDQEKGLMTFDYTIDGKVNTMTLEIPRTEDGLYGMLSGSTGDRSFDYSFTFNKLVYTDLDYEIVEKVYTDAEYTNPVSDTNPLIKNHKGYVKSIISNKSLDQNATTFDVFSDTLSNNNDQVIESVSDVAIDGVFINVEGAMEPNKVVSTPITILPGESKELTYSFITPNEGTSVNIKNTYLPRGGMTVKTTSSNRPIKPDNMSLTANNTVIKSIDAETILKETDLANIMQAKVLHNGVEELPTGIKVSEENFAKIKEGQEGKYPIEFIFDCNDVQVSLVKELTVVPDISVITSDKKGYITYKRKVIHISRTEKIDSSDKLIETIEAKAEYDGNMVPVNVEEKNVAKIGKHTMKVSMSTGENNKKNNELVPSIDALLTVVDNDAVISKEETAYINSKNIKISSRDAKRINNIDELKEMLELESEIDGEIAPVNISYDYKMPQGTGGKHHVVFWFDSNEIFKISEINVYEPIISDMINDKPEILNTSNINITNIVVVSLMVIIIIIIRKRYTI